MKWALSLFLIIFVSITGCKGPDHRLKAWMEEDRKVKILSTTAQIGDLVAAIGGDRIAPLVLIMGDLNPHTYELVKGDGEKFERADLIFYNGLGLEHGASLSSLLQANPKALSIGEWIAAQYPDLILENDNVVDPHIWMDIFLWEKAIDPIQEQLSAIDPEGASYFFQRAETLRAKMIEVDEEIRSLIHKIPQEKRYLVTSHDAFHYFARRYLATPGEENWALRFAAPEGLAPDGQLNPVDIQAIIDFLKRHQISVLFPESNVNRDSIRKIASAGKELGLEIQICSEALYGDSTSGLSYLESMRKNAEVLATHLK